MARVGTSRLLCSWPMLGMFWVVFWNPLPLVTCKLPCVSCSCITEQSTDTFRWMTPQALLMWFLPQSLPFLQLGTSLEFIHCWECCKPLQPSITSESECHWTRKLFVFVRGLRFSWSFELLPPNFWNLLHYTQSCMRCKSSTWPKTFFHCLRHRPTRHVQK